MALTRDDLPDWVIEGDRLGAPGFRALPVEGWPKRQAGLLAHFGDDGRLTFLLAFKYKSAEAAIWLRPDSGYLDAGIWGEAYHANGTLEDFAAAFDNDDPPRFADETFANWERRRVAFVVNKGEPLHGLPDLPSFDQERQGICDKLAYTVGDLKLMFDDRVPLRVLDFRSDERGLPLPGAVRLQRPEAAADLDATLSVIVVDRGEDGEALVFAARKARRLAGQQHLNVCWCPEGAEALSPAIGGPREPVPPAPPPPALSLKEKAVPPVPRLSSPTPEASGTTFADTVSHRGCELALWRRGRGVPVLFIQGTGLHGDGWLPQIDALSSSFDCIWFDNRGMSASQPLGDGPLTVELMALDAVKVLDHLGIARAHIVGHSLGGCIALQVALNAQRRCHSLSLLCTSSSGPGLVKMSPSMMWRGLRTVAGTRRSRRRAFLEMVLTPDEHASLDLDAVADELAPIFGHDLAEHPPVVRKQVRAMGRWDVTDRLKELEGLPTLVFGAGHDVIATPPLIDLLQSGMRRARVERWPDAAHGVTVTQAERVNALLAGFFDAA